MFSLFFEQLKEHAPNEPLPSGGRFWRVWRSGQSRFWSVLWWFFGFAWRLMFSVPGELGDCFHKLFPSNDPTEKSQVGLGQANVGPTRWRTACWWADLQTSCEAGQGKRWKCGVWLHPAVCRDQVDDLLKPYRTSWEPLGRFQCWQW